MNSTSTRSAGSLVTEAGQAVQRGEAAAALALIGEAGVAEPRNPEVVMAKAVLLGTAVTRPGHWPPWRVYWTSTPIIISRCFRKTLSSDTFPDRELPRRSTAVC